jgi:hypothetical protein
MEVNKRGEDRRADANRSKCVLCRDSTVRNLRKATEGHVVGHWLPPGCRQCCLTSLLGVR